MKIPFAECQKITKNFSPLKTRNTHYPWNNIIVAVTICARLVPASLEPSYVLAFIYLWYVVLCISADYLPFIFDFTCFIQLWLFAHLRNTSTQRSHPILRHSLSLCSTLSYICLFVHHILCVCAPHEIHIFIHSSSYLKVRFCVSPFFVRTSQAKQENDRSIHNLVVAHSGGEE